MDRNPVAVIAILPLLEYEGGVSAKDCPWLTEAIAHVSPDIPPTFLAYHTCSATVKGALGFSTASCTRNV